MGNEQEGVGYGPIYGLYLLSIIIPILDVGVRRLHDVGKSGWMMFFAVIPLIEAIWLLVLFCTDGVVAQNEYGMKPKK